jgi:drug/metabolite transporter superfamily protein YnfA
MTQPTIRTESRRVLLHALYTLVGIYLILLLSLFVSNKRPAPYDFMIAILCTVGMERIVTARWMLASSHA